MSYYLLRYQDNWADEMDLDGHTVLDQKEYQELEQALENFTYFCFSVGTNEEIEYESREDVEDVIEIEKISEEDYDTLEKLDLLSCGFAQSFIEGILHPENWDEDE